MPLLETLDAVLSAAALLGVYFAAILLLILSASRPLVRRVRSRGE